MVMYRLYSVLELVPADDADSSALSMQYTETMYSVLLQLLSTDSNRQCGRSVYSIEYQIASNLEACMMAVCKNTVTANTTRGPESLEMTIDKAQSNRRSRRGSQHRPSLCPAGQSPPGIAPRPQGPTVRYPPSAEAVL